MAAMIFLEFESTHVLSNTADLDKYFAWVQCRYRDFLDRRFMADVEL
jgi:hypothetical protein